MIYAGTHIGCTAVVREAAIVRSINTEGSWVAGSDKGLAKELLHSAYISSRADLQVSRRLVWTY